MRKYIILILAFITACSNPAPESTSKKKKDYNSGWEYEWYNKYSENISLSETANDTTGWTLINNFCTGAKYGIANVWGRGYEAEGIYPAEYLPSFFKRKLVLKEFSPVDGELSWMFTGEKGGITVFADSLTISLSQRYYNSIALNELKDGRMFMRRHGEKEIVRSDVHFSGNLKSIMVEMTSNQQIRLYANGVMVAEQLCMQDLTQHQLRYSGTKGNICGEIYSPDTTAVVVEVNPEITHQEIIGFGGIASVPSYYQLSDEGKIKWWNYLKEYNLLIQREYPNGSKLNKDCSNFDSLDQATAHYYGDNFPNGEISDFAYNKKIILEEIEAEILKSS